MKDYTFKNNNRIYIKRNSNRILQFVNYNKIRILKIIKLTTKYRTSNLNILIIYGVVVVLPKIG